MSIALSSSQAVVPKLSKSGLNLDRLELPFPGHPPANKEDAIGNASGMFDYPWPPFHQILGLAPEIVIVPRILEHEGDDACLPQCLPLKVVFSYAVLGDDYPVSFGCQSLDPLMVRRIGGKLAAFVNYGVTFGLRESVEGGGQMGRQVVVDEEFQIQAATCRSKPMAARTAGLGTSYHLDTLSTEPSTLKAANSASVGTP